MTQSIGATFEREHREIDDAVLAAAEAIVDPIDRQQLSEAVHALRRHIYAEEELMFPALRDAGLVGPVLVMLREHAEMWMLLDTLDELIASDDDSADALRDACARLLDLLQRHNAKEEAILYPQVDVVLDSGAASVLRELLVGGALPVGWRCQHALIDRRAVADSQESSSHV
ncbi:MAG TPA: hemerythrin domain-containing protein [Mycobacteriales bacterium]|nr:hemerythrin domain-containing protein [Mycobacteriales bacterium]